MKRRDHLEDPDVDGG